MGSEMCIRDRRCCPSSTHCNCRVSTSPPCTALSIAWCSGCSPQSVMLKYIEGFCGDEFQVLHRIDSRRWAMDLPRPPPSQKSDVDQSISFSLGLKSPGSAQSNRALRHASCVPVTQPSPFCGLLHPRRCNRSRASEHKTVT